MVVQPARGFLAGIAGGATLGFAVAGPAGAIGGAIGGGVLGPAIEWWYGLPTPVYHDPAELARVRQNLRPTPPPAADQPPINPAALAAARRHLKPTPAPAPYVKPPHPADHILATARQNLRPAPAPVPYQQPITPGALAAARQNLTPTAAPADLAAARLPPQGWSFGQPTVVPLSEQTKGKTLREMIRPTHSAILYMSANGQLLNANTVLPAGVHQIRSRWVANGKMGPITPTTLHVKPTIGEVMRAMGFASRGWRWELAWGTHGTLNHNFHLTVPKDSQTMPERMDNLGDIFRGLFPAGQGTTGTHMTIECRPTPGLSNAAYFLNGSPKYPQGFTKSEGEQFVTACRRRLDNWHQQALTSLRNALATL
jgi:hypothetical protein